MAIPTIQITGRVLTPAGAAPVRGTITARLSQPGSVLDGSTTQRVAAETSGTIGADGTVTGLALVPNDQIVPSGTYYEVRVRAALPNGNSGEAWSEKWQVPSGSATLDVGSVPRLGVVPGVAVVSAPAVAQAAADAQASATASAASASSSATAAASSASAAAGSASAAETAKTAAEAARDAAQEFSGGRYPRRYPLFIEGVADFNSGGFELPAGYINRPIAGASGYELTLTVTGAAGATTLTVNAGPVADAGVSTQGWGAVIRHDDGSWGVYTVTASNLTSTVTIRPALRKPVTLGLLSNIHDLPNGQHLTPNGSRALAEHLWRYPGWKAYRRGFIAQHREDATSDGPWVEINGLPEAWLAFSGAPLNYYPSSAPAATFIRTRNKFAALVAASANGSQGIEWTQPLYGKSGYVDSYFGADTNSPAFRVEIIIDGVTKLDKWSSGLERFAVRFENATTGTIRYTLPQGDGAQSHKYRLGTTTWWELPSDVPDYVIYDGARVVYVGDSWGAYYSGLLPSTIGAHLAATGGTLVNVAVGGQTAQWARDNFQSLVVANDPDIAIFEFFVNDRNALGAAGVDTWKANINWLITESLARGIQPVIVMPVPTSSAVQAQDLAFFGASLAEGWLSQ